MFKGIIVIDKEDGYHTMGWKFEFKGNKYGNVISDQHPTGRFIKVLGYDEDGDYYEEDREIYETVPLKTIDQIILMESMVAVMRKLEGEI